MTALFSSEYRYELTTPDNGGLNITLHQASSIKAITFFQASYNTVESMVNHMDSLTDELCEEWFRAAMSKDEQKVFRKAQKDARRIIEENARIEEARTAEIRKELKAAEKARKKERFQG